MNKKKIKVFTAFSGYDSQCMALEKLKEDYPDLIDYELIGWSEIDTPAIASHNAVFPEAADKNYGDISKIDWSKVPDFDLFTYSSPCLTEDQLILTTDGYKEIKDVNVGDVVLTKSNTLHPVVKKFDNGVHRTCYIEGLGFDRIHCTLNHKFWVRDRGFKKNPLTGGKVRDFSKSEPHFVEAKDLTKNHFFGIPVNNDSIEWHTNDTWFWYLCGMYIGDGWTSTKDSEVIFALSEQKLNKMKSIIPEGIYNYKVSPANKNNTCFRVVFRDAEFNKFLNDNFGRLCEGKNIPYKVLQLPKEQLQAFFDGYHDTDGCTISNKPNTIQFSSVNRKLIMMTSSIIGKLYHRCASIYLIKTPDTHIIEGRVVNQKDWYQLRFHTNDDYRQQWFYEDGYLWFPFKKRYDAAIENVYNIEVEEDHSYVLSGCVSANCQDWSICGKQRGGAEGSGTRSSLLWECKKTIEAKKPKFCILENVKALVSDKFLPYLKNWMALVDSMGYVSSFQVLNAGDYDIPQGRERVFMVSVRKDDDEPNPHYYFPSPVKKTREITDFLLPEVPEEYYLSDEKVPKFLDLLRNTGDDFDEKTTEHQNLVEEKKCAACEDDSQKDKEQELMETIGFVPENALF